MVDTYNPKNVLITFGDTSIKNGIADGTFVSVVRNARTRSFRPGSDGGGTIQVDPNRSAVVQITYLAGSQTNTLLNNIRRLEDASPGIHQVGTLAIEYFDGGSIIIDRNAFIDGPPDISFSTGEDTRVWTFICPNVDITVDGTSPPPRIGGSASV